MKYLVTNTAPLLLLALLPIASLAQTPGEYQGTFDRSNVLVVVEMHSGWMPPKVAALNCQGQLKIVGAYSDTTAILASVAPDSALAMINALMEMDFLGLPDEYREIRGMLKVESDNKVTVLRSQMMDAGSSTITLHIGPRKHSVKLRFPAYGAPEALIGWEGRFRDLISGQIRDK